MQVEKRFSHGIEFQVSYTLSKSFDQASSFENVLNPLDIRRSWALSLFDARNRLSDLLAKMDGNDELDAALQQIISNTEALKQIKSEGATVNA